jgi:subtilisin family serine protease
LGGRFSKEYLDTGLQTWKFEGMGTKELDAVLTEIRAMPGVDYAEPNYRIRGLSIPNDPEFDELWGLRNLGSNGGTPDADIDAELAWDQTTGNRDVVVAVLDTGVDYLHPDLNGNIWANVDEVAGNGIDDDGNGFVDDIRGYDFYAGDADPMDIQSHGTHCAGTIGAVGNNNYGVVGVAHFVSIMPVQIFHPLVASLAHLTLSPQSITRLIMALIFSAIVGGAEVTARS